MLQTKTTLLAVDDEEIVHATLRGTLKDEPYELLHAYDAGEALAILERRDDIEAIICDHAMPGIFGLDLLVRVHALWPHIATLLLTAHATVELATRAINEGRVNALLTKPWKAEDLLHVLRRILGEEEEWESPSVIHSTERKIREEMTPTCDEQTGAFIIGDPNEN